MAFAKNRQINRREFKLDVGNIMLLLRIIGVEMTVTSYDPNGLIHVYRLTHGKSDDKYACDDGGNIAADVVP
ncbi:hypothetical protein EGC79_17035 [Shewanella vesiculosa]|nr:hypothetical protein EGC79_17035 [Shewanella vesiculosa]